MFVFWICGCVCDFGPSMTRRGPQGLTGQVWGLKKKTYLLNGAGLGNGGRPTGQVWV